MLSLLPDLTVVEVANTIAPAYAGRLLADLGARVIALEPPGGTRLRHDRTLAPHFADFLAANKLSATMDFDAAQDPGLALALCRKAEILLYDASVPYLNRMLLDERGYEQSAVVLVLLTPWGYDSNHAPRAAGPHQSPAGDRPHPSPHAGLCDDELLHVALSGIASVTPEEPADERVERPMQLYGHQAQLAAGLTAAAAALQGWFAARQSGRAQLIDLAILDALISMPIVSQAAVFAGHPPPQVATQRRQTVPRGFYRCTDGYVYTQGGEENWPGWAQLLGKPEWVRPPYDEEAFRAGRRDEIGAAIQVWLDERSNGEVYQLLQGKGITAFPVNALPQVVADRQILARAVFQPIALPDGGSFLAPRTPIRLLRGDLAADADVVHVLGADGDAARAALSLEQEVM